MILVVTYEPHDPDADSEAVMALLESARSWANPRPAVWWLESVREPDWWQAELERRCAPLDVVFVAKILENDGHTEGAGKGGRDLTVDVAAFVGLRPPTTV